MPRQKAANKTPHPIRIDDADWNVLLAEAEKRSAQLNVSITASQLVRTAVSDFVKTLPVNAHTT